MGFEINGNSLATAVEVDERELACPQILKISYAFLIDFGTFSRQSARIHAHSVRTLEYVRARNARNRRAFSVSSKKTNSRRIFPALGHDSERHVRLHYCSRNHSAVLPARHRYAKSDRQKNVIVDAIAPCRQPVFTAIKHIRANVYDVPRPDAEKRSKKFRSTRVRTW